MKPKKIWPYAIAGAGTGLLIAVLVWYAITTVEGPWPLPFGYFFALWPPGTMMLAKGFLPTASLLIFSGYTASFLFNAVAYGGIGAAIAYGLRHTRWARAVAPILAAVWIFAIGQITTPPFWGPWPSEEERKLGESVTWCIDSVSNHEKGVAFCDRAIASGNDLTPGVLASMFHHRGWHYGNLGDTDRALSDYTRSLELNPNNPVTLYNRGKIYEHLGDIHRAKEDFTKGYEAVPPSSRGLEIFHDKAQEYGLTN